MPDIPVVPNEILEEIFWQCLPSLDEGLALQFPSTLYITPSNMTAPLLLCQICCRWRQVAIGSARLWESLDTLSIHSFQLLELWLSRARYGNLSLRIGINIKLLSYPRSAQYFPFLERRYSYIPYPHYPSSSALYLPILVPTFSQCRALALNNWPISTDFVMPASFPLLESLWVQMAGHDLEEAHSLSAPLLAHAPHLRRLHWDGPEVPLPWGQLLYISWCPASMDVFTRTVPQFTVVTFLRLEFSWGFFEEITLPEACVVPQVTTLLFHGNAAGLRTIVVPLLRHLVLQRLTVEDDTEQDLAIIHLLGQSQCAVETLEIHENCSPSFPSLVLLHDCIAPFLTRLLISSHDLNDFFSSLEAAVPDTLPLDIRLLRAVDRCFHIDRADFPAPGTAVGALALILANRFPRLTQLDLDDRFGWDDPVMACTVLCGERAITVRRNAELQREYNTWWNSWDGGEFRHALQSRNLHSLSQFEIPWKRIDDGPEPGCNVFARPL
ncbi:hypothetical protein C8R45DRAFT_1106706 [Mycena sanguinolenta]|nr:hypothetical protein C8R45DRAFT_1106706 [Mycena sanguinolenta]